MLLQFVYVAIGFVELYRKVCNIARIIASHLTSLYVCMLSHMGNKLIALVCCSVPLCGFPIIVQYFQAIQWYVGAAAVHALQLWHSVG